jgi:hypothetical protein
MPSKFIAKIISTITEPPVVVLIGLYGFTWWRGISDVVSFGIFSLIGLVPVFVLYLVEYMHNTRNDLALPRIKRDNVYLIGVFSFVFCSVVFGSTIRQQNFWFEMSMLWSVYFALLYVINHYFDKVSLHISTFALLAMLWTGLLDLRFSILLVFLPLIAWARLKLNSHTRLELLWGLVLGLLIGLLGWTISLV